MVRKADQESMRFTMRVVLLALATAIALPAAVVYSVAIDVTPADPYGGFVWSVAAQADDPTTYSITDYRLTGAESDAPRSTFLLSSAMVSDNDTFNYTAAFARIEYLLTIERMALSAATFTMQLDIPSDPLGLGAWITFDLPANGAITTAVADVAGVTATTVTEVTPEPSSVLCVIAGGALIALAKHRRGRRR